MVLKHLDILYFKTYQGNKLCLEMLRRISKEMLLNKCF